MDQLNSQSQLKQESKLNPAGTKKAAAVTLTTAQMSSARTFYSNQKTAGKLDSGYIKRIREEVSCPGSNELIDDACIQKIAEWQSSIGITGTGVDGQFGPTAQRRSGIFPNSTGKFHDLMNEAYDEEILKHEGRAEQLYYDFNDAKAHAKVNLGSGSNYSARKSLATAVVDKDNLVHVTVDGKTLSFESADALDLAIKAAFGKPSHDAWKDSYTRYASHNDALASLGLYNKTSKKLKSGTLVDKNKQSASIHFIQNAKGDCTNWLNIYIDDGTQKRIKETNLYTDIEYYSQTIRDIVEKNADSGNNLVLRALVHYGHAGIAHAEKISKLFSKSDHQQKLAQSVKQGYWSDECINLIEKTYKGTYDASFVLFHYLYVAEDFDTEDTNCFMSLSKINELAGKTWAEKIHNRRVNKKGTDTVNGFSLTTSSDSVNLRKHLLRAYDANKVAKAGTVLIADRKRVLDKPIDGKYKVWYHIPNYNGLRGWISDKVVTVTAEGVSIPTETVTKESVAQEMPEQNIAADTETSNTAINEEIPEETTTAAVDKKDDVIESPKADDQSVKPTMFEGPKQYKITASKLNVRTAPEVNKSTLTGDQVSKGDTVYASGIHTSAGREWLYLDTNTWICSKESDSYVKEITQTQSQAEEKQQTSTNTNTNADEQNPVEAASSKGWKADLVKDGSIKESELFESNDALSYGHQNIKGSKKYVYKDAAKTKIKYEICVGKEIKTGAGAKANAVKTLQALLNRSLKKLDLPEAKADYEKVCKGGDLKVNGVWDLNTATHLMYFIDMSGYQLANKYIAPYTVKCDEAIWKNLKSDSPSLDITRIRDYSGKPLKNVGGGSHKVAPGGEIAYDAMNKASGYKLSISSSFRAYSSQGMKAAGMANNSGQLELFALRVAGLGQSEASQPKHDATGASHMTGYALDINCAGGNDWLHKHCEEYGYEWYTGEDWHFSFRENLWDKSPHNPKNKKA